MPPLQSLLEECRYSISRDIDARSDKECESIQLCEYCLASKINL